jgi:hypothetical protein
MINICKITSFLIVLCSISSFAKEVNSSEETLKNKIFEDVYYSNEIGDRFCGKNSELLVREWERAGIDISKVEIWHVDNQKFGYFGMIKYYQNRFETFFSHPYPGDSNYTSNGSGGWFFHAFVVSDGKVYDSSYKRVATVSSIKNYLLDMFELKTDIGTEFYLRQGFGVEAMQGYAVEAYPAKKYIQFRDENRSSKPIKSDCGKIVKFLSGYTTSCLSL